MIKEKKKNWALRLMVLAMFLTLISACLTSGTLAKYVTTGTGSDTARVARWGVSVAGTGNLFSSRYSKNDSSYTLGAETVISADKVVAPGTSGALGSFTISGTPEVSSRVTVDVKDTSALTGWDYDLNDPANGGPGGAPRYYEPIVWKINGAPVAANAGGAAGSFGALKYALSQIAVDCVPNQPLSGVLGTSVSISWEWPYSVNDRGDTYYGDKASAPTAALAFDIVITQID